MTHEEFKSLAVSAVDGSLTAEQQREMRDHLASCPECAPQREVENEAPATGAWMNPWWLAIAAVLFLALWAWREVGIRVARERLASERAEIVALTDAKNVLEQQKQRLADELELMTKPGVRTIALSGQGTAAGASGSLFVEATGGQAVLVVAGLPDTSSEQDYQVWLFRPGSQPVSGALFDVTGGRATVSIDDAPADVASIAVTLEKNGGESQPGANVVLKAGAGSKPK